MVKTSTIEWTIQLCYMVGIITWIPFIICLFTLNIIWAVITCITAGTIQYYIFDPIIERLKLMIEENED